MPRRRPAPPLPQRAGLDPVWVRTPARVGSQPTPWASMRDFLRARLPERVPVDTWLAQGRFVDADGVPFTPTARYTPATFLWFHKDQRPELPSPPVVVLSRDERLVVLDKPHFQATTPRGEHVLNSALVAARTQLGLPQLTPAHRLDRLTAGVLVFTTEPRWRATYQALFERREVDKTYEALAPARPGLEQPRTIRSHLVKPRGSLQVLQVPDAEPNAETWLRLIEQRGTVGRYLLRPVTGRTHQLRVHLAGLGAPIIGDPLYPEVTEAPEDPAHPLRLVGRRLAFTDPVDGHDREFVSGAPLPWPDPR